MISTIQSAAQIAGGDCQGIDEEIQPNIFLGSYKFFLGKINFPTSFPNNYAKPHISFIA